MSESIAGTAIQRISVVIPTWNRADLLRAVLRNLQEQTRVPEEIIVVDNGSTDATEAVAAEFSVRRIAFPENRGFAVAVNAGIAGAVGEWIFILNNDVVLRSDWLAQALRSTQETSAAFVVGKLLRPDGSGQIDGSWDLISRGGYAWRCGYGKGDSETWSTRRTVHFAPMTAALFHRRVFEQIGMLETRFESYYEDVDLGVRCALAGINGVYEPLAVATHMSKTTLGKRSNRVYFLTARNQVFILAKYFTGRTLRRFAWPIVWGQLLSLGAAAKQRNFLPAVRGKWAGLRGARAFRHEVKCWDAATVEAAFGDSEREILQLQRQTGIEIYWKLYFSLVHPG